MYRDAGLELRLDIIRPEDFVEAVLFPPACLRSFRKERPQDSFLRTVGVGKEAINFSERCWRCRLYDI